MIALIGSISSGKSSIVNSFSGNIVAPVSLLKQTNMPVIYNLKSDAIVSGQYQKQKELDKNKTIVEEITYDIPSGLLSDVKIIDLPGFDDPEITTDNFFITINKYLKQTDLVLFVVDVTKPLTESIINTYDKTVNLIKKIGREKFIKLLIILNKYDDLIDVDLDMNYNNIVKKFTDNPIIKYSSHRILSKYMIDNNLIPKEDKTNLSEIKKILKNSDIIYKENTALSYQSDNFVYDELINTIKKIFINLEEHQKEWAFFRLYQLYQKYINSYGEQSLILTNVDKIENKVKNIVEKYNIIISSTSEFINHHYVNMYAILNMDVKYFIIKNHEKYPQNCIKFLSNNTKIIKEIPMYIIINLINEFGRYNNEEDEITKYVSHKMMKKIIESHSILSYIDSMINLSNKKLFKLYANKKIDYGLLNRFDPSEKISKNIKNTIKMISYDNNTELSWTGVLKNVYIPKTISLFDSKINSDDLNLWIGKNNYFKINEYLIQNYTNNWYDCYGYDYSYMIQQTDLINIVFVYACSENHLNVAKYIFNNFKIDIHYNNNDALEWACAQCNLEIAKWLCELGADIHIDNDVIFRRSCYNGEIEFAKWIYQSGSVDIHAVDDKAFKKSCEYGQIEVAKWLHQLGVNPNDDNVFMDACAIGHIDIVKWLYQLNVNIHMQRENAFKTSCLNGHVEIAKWLYELGVNIHVDEEDAFRSACENGHIKVAIWLQELDVDIHRMDNYAFRLSCENGHIQVAKWLYQLNVDMDINLNDLIDNIDDIEVIKWLKKIKSKLSSNI